MLVDGPDDVAAVTALTRQVALTPVELATEPLPDLGEPAGPPAEAGTNGMAFWDELGDALADNPPTTDAQRELLDRLATLGVGPGRHPSTEVTDPDVRAALEAGLADGAAQIDEFGAASASTVGWSYRNDLGTYGDDLLLRALVSEVGWGANVAEEALYPTATTDANGDPLVGSTGYRIRFEPGQAPPVDAFWSLTLYGPDRFFVPNDLGRFALGDRSPGLATPDGGLEIVVSATPPPGEEDRWLPAPAGEFSLMLRLYLPRPEAIDLSWTPPSIEPLAPPG